MVEKELRVKKIKNGTVIDHLPSGSALTVLKVLGIDNGYKTTVSAIMNVPSKSSGMKDVVKVEDKILGPEETDKLALIAPDATINIIKNYEVIKKSNVKVPEEVVGVLNCANPSCITNKNEPIVSIFKVENVSPILLRCRFCERILDKELIEEQF